MAVTQPQAKFAPFSPFKYIGGDPAIDFVDTVDWTLRGLEADRFTSVERVLEWAEGARILDAMAMAKQRELAAEKPAAARRVLRDALELRALLERIFDAHARDRSLEHSTVSDVAELNSRWLAKATGELALVERDGKYELSWPRADESLDSVLWLVAWKAAQLLASEDASRIERCGGPDCGWFYVDRSRNGLRRWCQMETCGTKMKSQRRAARKAS